MIWGVAGLRPNFFSSGRIFLAELAQEPWRDLAAVGYKAMGWGEKFWVTHTLVNLISATTASKAHTPLRSTSWIHQRERALQDEQEFCVLKEFLKDHNRLLDRNMLLMIKDVLVARYCSCISIWKDGQGDAFSNLEKLIALYDGGDAILVAAGNDGSGFSKCWRLTVLSSRQS